MRERARVVRESSSPGIQRSDRFFHPSQLHEHLVQRLVRKLRLWSPDTPASRLAQVPHGELELPDTPQLVSQQQLGRSIGRIQAYRLGGRSDRPIEVRLGSPGLCQVAVEER